MKTLTKIVAVAALIVTNVATQAYPSAQQASDIEMCKVLINRFDNYLPQATQDELSSTDPLTTKCSMLEHGKVAGQITDLVEHANSRGLLHNVSTLCHVGNVGCETISVNELDKDLADPTSLSIKYLGDETSPGNFSQLPFAVGQTYIDPIPDSQIIKMEKMTSSTLEQAASNGTLLNNIDAHRMEQNVIFFNAYFRHHPDNANLLNDINTNWSLVASVYKKANQPAPEQAPNLYSDAWAQATNPQLKQLLMRQLILGRANWDKQHNIDPRSDQVIQDALRSSGLVPKYNIH